MNFNSTNNTIERRVESLSNIVFEPTLTIFDNVIILNYKKVGTRFFQTLADLPSSSNNIFNNSKQIDIKFVKIDGIVPSDKYKQIFKTKLTNYLIEFDFEHHDGEWEDIDSFLKYNNVDNITDFFKKNKKPFIFVVRNPVERFFSGATQILSTYCTETCPETLSDINEQDKIKKIFNLTDYELQKAMERAGEFFEESFNQRLEWGHTTTDGVELFVKILLYILEYKWNLIMQDVHTETYLDNIKSLLIELDDKKNKIIDLNQCNTKTAFEFFDTFTNNFTYSTDYNKIIKSKQSNLHVYNFLVKIHNNDVHTMEAIPHLLKKEYAYYNELINSSYFYNI
jgi:hypothetical protein